MLDEQKRSVVVPIYKHKGDIQNCTNYSYESDYDTVGENNGAKTQALFGKTYKCQIDIWIIDLCRINLCGTGVL